MHLKRQMQLYKPPTARVVRERRELNQRKDKGFRTVWEFVVCVLGVLLIFTIIDFKFLSAAYYKTKYYEYQLLEAKSDDQVSFRNIRNQRTFYEYLNATFMPGLYQIISPNIDTSRSKCERNRRSAFESTMKLQFVDKLKMKVKNTKTKIKIKLKQEHKKEHEYDNDVDSKEVNPIIDDLVIGGGDSNTNIYKLPDNQSFRSSISDFENDFIGKENESTQNDDEHDAALKSTKLISILRLRQQRVTRDSCTPPDENLFQLRTSCNDHLNPMSEDISSYEQTWKNLKEDEVEFKTNTDVNDNCLADVNNPWLYQTEEITNTAPRYGPKTKMTYNGGGYILNMGHSKRGLPTFFRKMIVPRWLDDLTRVIFIEASLYNPNINAVIVVSLMVERLATHNYLTDAQIGLMKPLTSSTMDMYDMTFKYFLFLLLIILYVVQLIYSSRYGTLKISFFYDVLILVLTIVTCTYFYQYGTCLSGTFKFYQSSVQVSQEQGRIGFKQHVSFTYCYDLLLIYQSWLAMLTLLLLCRFIKLLQFTPFRYLSAFKSFNLKLFFRLLFIFCLVFVLLFVLLQLSPKFILFVMIPILLSIFIDNIDGGF
uniref:Polycystic kidney disease protein 1-like 2 n=1 Tax=Cacopsylla melanoneura TaxID=428564 RepID=A0A8D8TIH8_9HEMI